MNPVWPVPVDKIYLDRTALSSGNKDKYNSNFIMTCWTFIFDQKTILFFDMIVMIVKKVYKKKQE